jgi:hypothetical protein
LTTSESTRPSRGRIHSSTKRQRADATGLARRPPFSSLRSERARQLENVINDLKRQLHDALVANILDLRVAGGLISETERSKSYGTMGKLSNEALEFMRRDLVKIFARINTTSSPAPSMTKESSDYIA